MSGISVVGVTSPVPLEDLAAPVSKGAFVVGDGPGNSPEEVILATDKIFFGDPGPATGVSQATLTSFARTLIDDTTAVIALQTLGALDPAGISGGQTVTGGADASDDLIFASTSDATKGVIRTLDVIEAKKALLFNGTSAVDRGIQFDRPDTTTPSNIRWTEAGAERWSYGVVVGSQDFRINNSNSTGDILMTPLGSTISQGKINGTVVSISRGSDGHTADVWQAQTFAEVVVASMSIAGKQTVTGLEVTTGPIVWGNGTGQDYEILQSSALPDGLAIQGQDSATNSFVNLFAKDGDATDFAGYRVISKGSPTDLANQEQCAWLWEPVRLQYELATLSVGGGTARALALISNGDTNQFVLNTNSTISSQGATIIDATGQHVGTWAGTAVAVAFGGTGATTAAGARTNLGLVIDVDVQADLDLVSQVDAEAGTATDERVWSALRVAQAISAQASALNDNFAFAFDTTTQAISVANTFQGLNLSTNGVLNGWTHVAGTSILGCTQSGEYRVTVNTTWEKSTGGTASIEIRALFNSVEEPGSMDGSDIINNNFAMPFGTTFMVDATAGQDLEIEVASSSTNVSILPGPDPGGATTDVSAKITITRIS